MKIVVVGLGYVGLANAALLAQYNEVIGVDLCKQRVDLINDRVCPLEDEVLQKYFREKELNLVATTELLDSIVNANYVIIATPTNYDTNSGYFDTSSIDLLIKTILEINRNINIVIKSTIPVGYVQNIRLSLRTEAVFFSPEFLREGLALHDNLYPSRIIVGEKSLRAEKFAELMQQGALKPNIEVVYTDPSEAEAIKLFANSYLAMRVAFFNELDSYALENDLSTAQIIEGVCSDPRIGNMYNNPSFGYGGYCLPKDTKQMLSNFVKVPQNLISAIVESNETRKQFLSDKIISLSPNTVGIFRLQMKYGSDNFRESAVFDIIQSLISANIQVVIYEPNFKEKNFSGVRFENDLLVFKRISDLIVSNRHESELGDVSDKVFTRDLFNRD